MNLYEARRLAEEAKTELPRARVTTQRRLIAAVEALADEVDQLQKERAATLRYGDLYVDLVEDWNAVDTAFRTAGIDVSSPSVPGEKIPVWVWKCADGATGTAATVGAAMAAALEYRIGKKED